MRRLFKVGADRHGSNGKVVLAWHPDGNFLATAGKNGRCYLLYEEIVMADFATS